MKNIQTIITGHGKYATGIRSAIELLAGPQESFKYIDFSEGLSEEDLAKEFNKNINTKLTLIFCDLVGGTPYKVAAKLAFENKNIKVVAGCNLASILETIFNQYNSLDNYAYELVKISKMGTQILELDDISPANEISKDGI